jgi:hypothetical protein
MTNPGKAQRRNEAEAPVRGAIDTSRPAAGALPKEAIRARAYQLYREREGRGGDATGDWLAAERELRESIQARAQPAPGTVDHGRAQ